MSDDEIGPALPPGFQTANSSSASDEDDDCVGPALPPGYSNKETDKTTTHNKPKVVGPTLPPGLTPVADSGILLIKNIFFIYCVIIGCSMGFLTYISIEIGV